jgi:hypothetical protein
MLVLHMLSSSSCCPLSHSINASINSFTCCVMFLHCRRRHCCCCCAQLSAAVAAAAVCWIDVKLAAAAAAAAAVCSFQLQSLQPLSAGEELTISYGATKPNAECFRDYGFIVSGEYAHVATWGAGFDWRSYIAK